MVFVNTFLTQARLNPVLIFNSSIIYCVSSQVIKSLRLDAKLQVPADYEKSFKQADETFLYQLVFDPLLENLVPLNELPEGLKPGDLQFAGPYPFETVLQFEIQWSLCLRSNVLDCVQLQVVQFLSISYTETEIRHHNVFLFFVSYFKIFL